MKIVLFTDTFLPQVNGVIRVVDLMATALVEHGHEVMVVVPEHPGQTHIHKPYAILSTNSIPLPWYPGERLAVPTLASVQAIIKFKPDIFHAHTPFSLGLLAAHLSKTLKIPLVGTHHTFFDHYLKYVSLDYRWAKTLSWWMTNAFYNKCTLVITPTQALSDVMKAHGLVRELKVVHNPVDLSTFTPPTSEAQRTDIKQAHYGPHTMVYMGRVAYEKDLDQTLRVFAAVHTVLPDAQFVIVGDGPYRKELELQAKKLGLSQSVHCTGFLQKTDLSDAVKMHDVFVTCATSENMPVSVLEAFACGVPVVAVSALGIPEMVKDGVNGYLVPVGDVQGMAKKIVSVLTNHDIRTTFSVNAQRLADAHKPATIALQHEELYRSLVQNPARSVSLPRVLPLPRRTAL